VKRPIPRLRIKAVLRGPVSCPACFGSALMPEHELLRLPHTIMFHCPYCQRVVMTVDKTRGRGSPPTGGKGDARAA
jgi:hypothetical protein